jgi:hypothetical protein
MFFNPKRAGRKRPGQISPSSTKKTLTHASSPRGLHFALPAAFDVVPMKVSARF